MRKLLCYVSACFKVIYESCCLILQNVKFLLDCLKLPTRYHKLMCEYTFLFFSAESIVVGAGIGDSVVKHVSQQNEII